MPRNRPEAYKEYIELGDDAIPERTVRRYRAARGDDNDARGVDGQFQAHIRNLDQGIIRGHDLLNIDHAMDADLMRNIRIPQQTTPNDLFQNLQQLEDEQGVSMDEPEEVANYLRNIILHGVDDLYINQRKKAPNIYEFIQDRRSSEPIAMPVDKNRGEILLMILKYALANKSSVTGLVNLFKLTNAFFLEPILPDSKYLVDKLFEGTQGKPEFHALCHECTAYLGKFGQIPSDLKNCPKCATPVDVSKPSSSSFFVIIDPSDQIADILKIHGDYYDWVLKERVSKDGVLEDIMDGLGYIDFQLSLPPDRRYCYVSGSLNTDGAEKFDNSMCSVWPILYQIHELPPQIRMKHLVTCGLYVHKRKPEMTVFIEPFVDKMNHLTENGITCEIKGENRTIYPYVNNDCVDSSARGPLLGFKLYCAYCGCPWCEHPGVHAEGSVRFPYKNFFPRARDEERYVQSASQATPEDPVDGIVYPSPLINLKKFKIIKGTTTEYMHQSLEGNGKRIAEIHFDSLNAQQIKELDAVMEQISVPCQLCRLTRKISERKLWKAREWENFILYYSIPIFYHVLSKKHFEHWLLFAGSLYTLLQDRIEEAELNEANVKIHTFVEKTETYFGIKEMTSNMHGSLHLCENVARWGPLWGISAFPFETQNRYVLEAIKCAKGATQQMTRSLMMKHVALVLEEHIYPDASGMVKFYCGDVLSARTQHVFKLSDITYLGLSKEYRPSGVTSNLGLSDVCTRIYSRMIKDGCLYSSRNNRRSNDSVAQLRDKSFIKILDFIVDDENNLEFTLYKRILSRTFCGRKYSKFHIVESVIDEIKIVASTEIERVCVFFEVYGDRFICPVPNLLHY